MKTALLILILLVSATVASGQMTSSRVIAFTVYSQNEQFYLKTVPFDNEIPGLRGKTFVYATGRANPLYVFERGFTALGDIRNDLILSNDGEVIFYAISWGANEKREGLKSVNIYRHGKIVKSLTEEEVTGCVDEKERCSLVYSNFDSVVDSEKSKRGTKVFKEGVEEKERFLSDFPLFSFDDTVYLTDSKKRVHIFDLREGSYVGSEPFETIFERIKDKGRLNKRERVEYEAPIFLNFPKLQSGEDTSERLAELIGMKPASMSEEKDKQYRLYNLTIDGVISQDGSLEIEKIESDDQLPRERIIEFFRTNRFDVSYIPKVFEKWHLRNQYFYFRNKRDELARQEKQQQVVEERKELERRLTLESIDGIYIPKNLEDCFLELDKLLPEIDKKEMRALTKSNEMVRYHMGLGMWMRNNWRLWAGSRLQKYFTDRGISHPDDMSGIILRYYYDWLSGRKEAWKDWEKHPGYR
jgi:hypothetical protein